MSFETHQYEMKVDELVRIVSFTFAVVKSLYKEHRDLLGRGLVPYRDIRIRCSLKGVTRVVAAGIFYETDGCDACGIEALPAGHSNAVSSMPSFG